MTKEFREIFGAKARTDLLVLMPFGDVRRWAARTGAHQRSPAIRGITLGASRRRRPLRTDHPNEGRRLTGRQDVGKLAGLHVEILDALDKAGHRFALPPTAEVDEVKKKIIDACTKFNKVPDRAALEDFLRGKQ